MPDPTSDEKRAVVALVASWLDEGGTLAPLLRPDVRATMRAIEQDYIEMAQLEREAAALLALKGMD